MHIKCSFCDKVLAKSETKNCGSCKAVIYCSRECQKAGWWMNHKEICARISNPQNANDELRLWCTFWSPSFMHTTIWALDVQNNPGRNMKYTLMVFVEKTKRTDPVHRYRIYGECLVPMSMPILKNDLKSIKPDHFYFSVQEPAVDDGGFHFRWNSIITSVLSKPRSALLAKLAFPILRHLTETVSHVDAMSMWDPTVWLSQPHPVVKPENITVLPEEISSLLGNIAI